MLVNGESHVIELGEHTFHCAMDLTMHFIGGKWKASVLWYLRGGPLRFGELRRKLPDMTEKMLSLQLKKLEADGLVQRQAFDEVPPRVEYCLTAWGLTLLPVLEAVASWGRDAGSSRGRLRPA